MNNIMESSDTLLHKMKKMSMSNLRETLEERLVEKERVLETLRHQKEEKMKQLVLVQQGEKF